jgi:hypothetical protein
MTVPQTTPILGVELRFRANPDPGAWAKLLEAILAWEPRLRPTHVERRDAPDAPEPVPWTPQLADELARRCAGGRRPAWVLTNERQEVGALVVARQRPEVEVDVTLPAPPSELPAYLAGLLRACRQAGMPVPLALLFDAWLDDQPDYLRFGTWKLEAVPPLLYLDERVVERAGGRGRVLAAPCPVVEMEHGGLLLSVRVPPWGPPSPTHRDRTAAVERHLGVGRDRPLDLSGD